MKISGFIILLVFIGFSVFAQSLPSGGLGLTQKEWELNHTSTGQGVIGTMYDQVEVVFKNEKITQIELNLTIPISVEQAKAFAKELLPRDAKFVKEFNPLDDSQDKTKTRDYKKAFLYTSDFLQGEFHYQYNEYQNPVGVFRMIVALGNDSLKASRIKQQNMRPDDNFANCNDLNAKFPDGVPEGHPSYRPGLDRNRNGWACEPTPRSP